MIFLLGTTRKREYLAVMKRLGWGRLFSSETPRPLPGEPWALDNAVFLAWKAKVPWDEQRFLSALIGPSERSPSGAFRGRSS